MPVMIFKVSDQKPWKTTFHGNGAALKKRENVCVAQKLMLVSDRELSNHTKINYKKANLICPD